MDDYSHLFDASPATGAASRIALGRQLGLHSGDALLAVDVQRDFLPGGSMPVLGGNRVIPALNAYVATFVAHELPVFFTRDWHPESHCSFRQNGGRWPAHCVQGTLGAEWPAQLHVPDQVRIVSKATDAATEAYSGFWGTALLALLRGLKVRRVFIGGLATDYCVHDTAMDARKYGFEVVLLADAIAAVNAQPGDATRAIRTMLEQGVTLFECEHCRH